MIKFPPNVSVLSHICVREKTCNHSHLDAPQLYNTCVLLFFLIGDKIPADCRVIFNQR